MANPAYTGPVKPHLAGIDDVAFTSVSAEFDQLLTGKLDVGFIDFSDLPQVPNLVSKGYSVFGYPDFGFAYVGYNFKDPTGDFDHIISQLYIRQVLAHLQDEQAEIKSRGLYNGAAGQAYGPVPAIPVSPFTPSNALANPYPFSIAEATKQLTNHGWKVVPNGTTTCQNAGTAAGQCGAGIPKGTALSWNLYYASGATITEGLVEAWVSNLKQVGINVSLSSKTFNYITGELSDVSAPANAKLWAMEDFGGFTDDYYPTTNELFNTTGSFNQGGFSNAQLDQDILNSEFSLKQHRRAKRAHPGHLRAARALPAQRGPPEGVQRQALGTGRELLLRHPRAVQPRVLVLQELARSCRFTVKGAQSSWLRPLAGTCHCRRTVNQ